jgi:hypothetical protein
LEIFVGEILLILGEAFFFQENQGIFFFSKYIW